MSKPERQVTFFGQKFQKLQIDESQTLWFKIKRQKIQTLLLKCKTHGNSETGRLTVVDRVDKKRRGDLSGEQLVFRMREIKSKWKRPPLMIRWNVWWWSSWSWLWWSIPSQQREHKKGKNQRLILRGWRKKGESVHLCVRMCVSRQSCSQRVL